MFWTKMITLYSGKGCPWCVKLQSYLDSKGVKYNYKDIADKNHASEMMTVSGQMGIPVLKVDDTIIIGFDKEKVNETLKL